MGVISADGGDSWTCPECRTEQNVRAEQLTRNFALEKNAWNYKDSLKNMCSDHHSPKKLRKYQTLRSCLLRRGQVTLQRDFRT